MDDGASLTDLRTKLGAAAPDVVVDWISLLLYGEPGSGKTHFIGTAADHPETSPVLLIDVDGGYKTIRHKKNIDRIQARTYDHVRAIFIDLYNAVENDELPYKTVALDSGSELYKIDLMNVNREYSDSNAKIEEDVPDQRSYYKTGNHITKIVRAFKDLPCNFIMTAHESTDRDNFNRLTRAPQFAGKMKVDVPGFVDVVAHLRVEVTSGKPVRFFQTMKTETLIAKDRLNAFEGIEQDPTFPSLWDKFQATNNAEGGK